MKLKNSKVKLEGWEMFGHDGEQELLGLLSKYAKDIANIFLADVRAYFPKDWAPRSDGWHGDDVPDPLTIYLVDDGEQEVFSALSLTEVLERSIKACEEDGSFSVGLRQVSEKMKDLAAQIDAACAKHE